MATALPDRGAQLTELLRDGETVRWQGSPDPSLRFGPADLILIPFFTLWGGFALFWNFAVWGSGAPVPFKLFGIPFLVIGGYVTVGRFIVAARRKRRTTYAITTERAIIIDDRNKVRYVELDAVLHETRTRRRGAAITVQFRPPSEPAIGRLGQNFDPRLTGIPLGGSAAVGPAAFFFCDVSDAQALLVALADAPMAK